MSVPSTGSRRAEEIDISKNSTKIVLDMADVNSANKIVKLVLTQKIKL